MKNIIYFTKCNNLSLNITLIKTIWWQVGYSYINYILFSTSHELLKIVQMFHYRHILYYFDRIHLILNIYVWPFWKCPRFSPWIFQSYFAILSHIALHYRHNMVHSKGPPKWYVRENQYFEFALYYNFLIRMTTWYKLHNTICFWRFSVTVPNDDVFHLIFYLHSIII